MAQYDVTHSCGHNQHIYLTGPHRNREYRMDRMREEICPDCWRAQQHQAALAAASRIRDLDQLPPLTGSVRQVAWATDIRATALAGIDAAIREIDARGTIDQQEAARMARQLASQQASARWWIDHRHLTGIQWLADFLREHGIRPVVTALV